MYLKKGLPGFGLALLTCVFPSVAQTVSTASRVRVLNNDLLRLSRDVKRAAPEEAIELRKSASKTIEVRTRALTELIGQNPDQAESFLFSREVIAGIRDAFPELAGELETDGIWTGRIEQWTYDLADGSSRTVTLMGTADGPLELSFKEGGEPELHNGDELTAEGLRAGNRIIVTQSKVISSQAVCAAGAPVTQSAKARPLIQAALATQTCASSGPQNVAVLLVTFPGMAFPVNITAANVYDMFFNAAGPSLSSYWREVSYGQLTASGNVFGPYVLDSSYADCGRLDLLRDAAITAAAGAGVNFQNYSRVFIVHSSFNCGWTGLALNGCTALNSPTGSFTASVSFLDANWQGSQVQGAQNAAHEGGHNLGLAHAQLRTFGSEALGPLGAAGTLTEYGDPFSDMSTSNIGHYAAPHKAGVLQWIANGANYQTVQTSGSWTLQPLELSPAGLVALRVQRGTGNNAWLWIEYRQSIGIYDSTIWPPAGAIVHYEDASTLGHSQLLDMTPGTSGAYDVALLPGNTWVDPYSNLSLAIQSATPSGLTVSVTYGATSCTHAAPTVSISPSNATLSAGSSTNYAISVKNNDSAGCAAATFNMGSQQPVGWASSFSAPSLLLSPGQTGSLTMTDTVPSGTQPGTYPVSASSANGTFVGSGNANCTVVDNSTTLANSLAISGSTFSTRQTVSIASTVTSGGRPVANSAVTFTITKSNGTTVTGKVTADSSGKATWSYKVAQKDPPGSYTAISQATYNAQTVSSSPVTFAVQ